MARIGCLRHENQRSGAQRTGAPYQFPTRKVGRVTPCAPQVVHRPSLRESSIIFLSAQSVAKLADPETYVANSFSAEAAL
jgi:hypothetical protein